MSAARQWKYVTGSCYYKETKKAGVFSGAAEGEWMLHVGEEYPLVEGLNVMGGRGWELVGIQPLELKHGGSSGSWYRPIFYYVFKQPAG